MRFPTAAVIAATLTAMLSGCDNGPSAVETRDRTAAADTPPVAVSSQAAGDAARTEPTPTPPLTANRRETADAKIERLYQRNGAAFGARSPEDYLAQIKAFTEGSPPGVEKANRPNGDTLLYQASTNTFAVVSRDGTPRTMFKPDDGPAYWAEQKQRAPSFGRLRSAAD